MLVLGEKETAEKTISVRRQGKGDLGTQSVDAFIHTILHEIKNRTSEEQVS